MTRSDTPPVARHNNPARSTAAGCVFALTVALVTGILLLLNGALVLALLKQTSNQLPQFVRKPQILQFLLFFLPVVLAVAEWILLDAIRALFRRRES